MKTDTMHTGLPWRIGHHHQDDCGCSVVLLPKPMLAAASLLGAAPSHAETALLEPHQTINYIDAILLTGGSSWGLASRNGVMRYLAEQGRGLTINAQLSVPIVPTLAINDLSYGQAAIPNAEMAYQASVAASQDFGCGNIGVGRYATVAKLWPNYPAAPGGIGYAEAIYPRHMQLGCLAVVNAVGVIHDGHGQIIVGGDATLPQPARWQQLKQTLTPSAISWSNTVLLVLMTNVKLDCAELQRLCRAGAAGLPRAIWPAMTPYDGDIIMAISSENGHGDVAYLTMLAADVVQQAIMNAISSRS